MESAIENLRIDAEKQDTENQQLTTRIELLENNAFSTPTVILKQKTSLNSLRASSGEGSMNGSPYSEK